MLMSRDAIKIPLNVRVHGSAGGDKLPDERGIARVAVLGVRQDDELVVAGERVDRGRVLVPVEHPRLLAVRGQPQLAAVVGRPADSHERRPDLHVEVVKVVVHVKLQ